MDPQTGNALLELTAQIVAAHVANNTVSVPEMPSLIEQVHRSLAGLGNVTAATVASVAERPQPAVPVKKSITEEFLICLEDGQKLKTLKRHLKVAFGMTPDQYRERWGLPSDYPMVAPSYSKQRSTMAKQSGLGTSPRSSRPKSKRA